MTTSTDASGEAPEDDCCKVGRVLAAHDLSGLAADLGERWRRDGASVRGLQSAVNVAVLRAAADDAGHAPLAGEAENLYRLLTDDDVTGGARVRARRRLEADGVDVDAVRESFVSHQTVYNHLTDCLAVEHESGPSDPVADAEDRVRPLQARLEAVAADALARLDREDALSVGDPQVYVDVAVTCDDCGRRREFGDLLAAGGCDCQSDR